MKTTKVLLAGAAVILFSSCSSTKSTHAWATSFNSGVPFEQAFAKCDYETERSYPNGRLSMSLFGMQHPVFEKCMNSYGYRWEKNTN